MMASVRRFWCNRILYCPRSIGNKPPLMATHFPVFLLLGRRGTVHESVVVIFPAGEGCL